MFSRYDVSTVSTTYSIIPKENLDKIQWQREKEAADVEEFKETKMGELLDYNVKLSDLQNQYSSVFEGTGEKRRTLDNMEERKIEKR